MARPTDLSLERVTGAAEALEAQGIEPTVDALRKELGGSDSTILRFLRLWKEQRRDYRSNATAVTIPPNVDAVLRGWIEGHLAQVRGEHDAVLAAERVDRARVELALKQRTVELDDARNAMKDLQAVLRQRDDQVIKAQSDLTDVMARLTACEREQTELGRQLEHARRDTVDAETRALLAEQRAMLLEHWASTTPARSNPPTPHA